MAETTMTVGHFPHPDGTHTDSCVVYDRNTGQIVHVHEELTLPGARRPSEAELLETAVSLASASTGRPSSGFASLRVERGQMKEERGLRYRVDLKANRLLEEQVPPRPRQA